MKKLKLFLSLSPEMKWLFFEVYVYLAYARILKSRSFSKVSSSLGEEMKETTKDITFTNKRKLAQVSQVIGIVSHYTFWKSDCFVKAVAAMRILKKQNIESTLYFGIAKDETGQLMAHAWLRSGPFIVTGYEGKDQFTIVNTFAKTI